ncbi:hypothetical protein AX15_000491 [Amanita polypyramis BW_CC]|nr:hypothetical protein AX15_000491 [Amanita polypyramis BW_CC]
MADFPRLIKDAAEKFKNETVAYAQIRSDNNRIKVRVQSLELARQFEGDVTYGRDAKGVLFYNDELSFQVTHADLKYRRYGSLGDLVTVEVGFYHRGDANPYAIFVARVPPFQLPAAVEYGEGDGNWADFRVGCSQTRALRVGSDRINLLFAALRKMAYFPARSTIRIDTCGILVFKDYKTLETSIRSKKSLVKITPDLLSFYLDGEPDNILAVFVPAGTLDVSSSTTSTEAYSEAVTWEDLDPNGNAFTGEEGN